MNKRIIILDHRLYQQSIYALNMSVYLDFKVDVASTIKEVLQMLQKASYDFIFVDNLAYSRDLAKILYLALDGANHKIPLYVLGDSSLRDEDFYIFDSRSTLKTILKTMATSFKITAKYMAELDAGEYYPLETRFLVPGWCCNNTVYKKNGLSYDEVLLESSVVTDDFLERMDREEITHLYLLSKCRLQFINSLTLQLSARLNDPTLSYDERLASTATGHQIIMEQARSIGINEGTIEMTNACIKSIETMLVNMNTLSSFLEKLLSLDDSYLFKHSLLTCFIGIHLIKKTAWGSREEFEKFTFVCFFHDISLRNDDFSKISTQRQLEEANLCEEDARIVENHALLSEKILSNYHSLPNGVVSIIKQHHGSKSGVGFGKYHKDLSPMAVIFMLSEEWANYCLNSWEIDGGVDKNKLIKLIAKKFNAPPFLKIIPYLNSLEI